MLHIRKMPSCDSFSRVWDNVLVVFMGRASGGVAVPLYFRAVSVLYPVEIENRYICHHVS
jgi:hypothetical protein